MGPAQTTRAQVEAVWTRFKADRAPQPGQEKVVRPHGTENGWEPPPPTGQLAGPYSKRFHHWPMITSVTR